MILRHAGRARGAVLGLAFGAAAVLPGAARAQFVEPPPPAAFAIRNATVVHADGRRTAGQTIVIRAGRIEGMGAGVTVPPDAQVIAGDSLFVHPGIIDGAGVVKFEFPADTTSRERVRAWDPPRTVQGYMPSRRVLDHLAATGRDVADLRRHGVVAVAVHPPLSDPLMPGRGAFLVLRRDAVTPQQLVADPVLPPVLTLRGGRGAYPATGMAVVQWYRQLFMDAQRQAQVTQVAAADPRAVIPPPHDPDLAVVQEMLRDGRVFMVADQAEEIRRALRLAEEFRLRPVIVGGAEAWRVADELRSRNVTVLVDVDFPTPRRWKPESADTAAPATPDPGVVREQRQFEDRYANAGRLAQAGVTFALVSRGRGDLRAGVRKAMEYGLPEDAALRAVTATPAALYGAARLARIETGLPASLVITDGPLFGKDTRILYTFVEGSPERGTDARARPDAAGAAAEGGDTPAGDIVNVAGTWRVEVLTDERQTFSMRLAQEGSIVTGSMEGPMGDVPLEGRIEGDRLTLTGTLNIGAQSLPLNFTGRVSGDDASGTVSSPMGDADWSARRTGPGAQS
jgi:imidazolonepropionase-like amidohydrolase